MLRKITLTGEELAKACKATPIRHPDGLDPFLTDWARQLFDRVGQFIRPTFEQWEIGFMRDTNPHRELFVFEAIARTFESYLAEWPQCDKRKVAGILSGISMGAEFKEEDRQTRRLRAIWLPIWQSMSADPTAVLKQVAQTLPDEI
jgi:hypothetical protein